ncbi:MAG TPA: flagellar motor stator protein MotA [Gemmatimonadales bacterium]
MNAIVGFIVVMVAVFGGFALAGGPFAVLLAWSEWIVICGTGVGTVLISTPPAVLKMLVQKLPKVMKPSGSMKPLYLDALKLLFELFQLARRDGVIAIESHIEQPDQSIVFKRYPQVLAYHHAVEFLCDALRTVLVGSVPAFDLESMLEMEIEVHHESDEKTVQALQRLADALPGIGIVAAVLGIVVTMQSLGGPIEQIGHHVASALVGTFLGILLSYGFISPIASNMEARNADESRLYFVFKAGTVAFAKNLPPMVAVEFARKAITAGDRPTFVDMETAVKTTRLEKAA